MSEIQEETISTDDVIKIMVATDNHLGYYEKDPVRGNDSFNAFEEILELAIENDVDFILLGGDLFHDATPSQNSLLKCFKLLRNYTLGDKPIALEFLSDQSINFVDSLNQTVNYEDPNLNVSIPVFSIHGNHDDPSGFGRLSSLDLLSTTGLINYFGKWSDLTKVEINPILLKKGVTQLALYGLSHIHDARLARLFRDSKVVMDKPDESTGEWFNLMVLHQNRADRGPKNYLPEDILPKFLDLLIWGHEHDCRIEPEENAKQNFYVCQPGSSVPTSLSEGESIPKHCGLLMIHRNQFKLDPIPLKTIRPFVFESIDLHDYVKECALDEGDAQNKVIRLATEKIKDMLIRAEEKKTGHPRQPVLPLIRLRIIYHEEDQMFNAIRFGQQYNEKVANPMDIIHFKKFIKRTKFEARDFDKAAMKSAVGDQDTSEKCRVEDIVDRYFETVDDTKKLQLMSSKILSEMCYSLVEKNDTNAADSIIRLYKEKATDFLMDKLPSEEDVEDTLELFKSDENNTYESILKLLDERGTRRPDDIDSILNVTENDPPKRGAAAKTAANTTTTRGRGRGRGRGAKVASTKPELDVTVMKKEPKQTTLTSIRKPTISRGNPMTYCISDSD